MQFSERTSTAASCIFAAKGMDELGPSSDPTVDALEATRCRHSLGGHQVANLPSLGPATRGRFALV